MCAARRGLSDHCHEAAAQRCSGVCWCVDDCPFFLAIRRRACIIQSMRVRSVARARRETLLGGGGRPLLSPYIIFKFLIAI
jgi:hypothetical protein